MLGEKWVGVTWPYYDDQGDGVRCGLHKPRYDLKTAFKQGALAQIAHLLPTQKKEGLFDSFMEQ